MQRCGEVLAVEFCSVLLREERNRQAADIWGGGLFRCLSATTALGYAPFRDKAGIRMFNTFALVIRDSLALYIQCSKRFRFRTPVLPPRLKVHENKTILEHLFLPRSSKSTKTKPIISILLPLRVS